MRLYLILLIFFSVIILNGCFSHAIFEEKSRILIYEENKDIKEKRDAINKEEKLTTKNHDKLEKKFTTFSQAHERMILIENTIFDLQLKISKKKKEVKKAKRNHKKSKKLIKKKNISTIYKRSNLILKVKKDELLVLKEDLKNNKDKLKFLQKLVQTTNKEFENIAKIIKKETYIPSKRIKLTKTAPPKKEEKKKKVIIKK